jgi:hypothetical protein
MVAVIVGDDCDFRSLIVFWGRVDFVVSRVGVDWAGLL